METDGERLADILGAYYQGKADAIEGVDEIIQFIKDNSFDHRLEYDSFKVIGSSVIIDLLQQLKEEK